MVESGSKLLSRLAGVDLFAGLDETILSDLAGRGVTFHHPPGDRIVKRASTSDVGLRVLLEGEATVEIDGIVKAALAPGDFFGEMSLLDHEPRSADVVAGPQGARVFALSPLAFDPLLDHHPDMARTLLRTLARRVRAAEDRLGDR